MIVQTNADRYKGEKIARFEGIYGDELENLVMVSDLVIVFESGKKIILKQDWRGDECYFSQHTEQ